jgi:hypothetical protein
LTLFFNPSLKYFSSVPGEFSTEERERSEQNYPLNIASPGEQNYNCVKLQ